MSLTTPPSPVPRIIAISGSKLALFFMKDTVSLIVSNIANYLMVKFFRVFIQKEFGKQHKQNKTTAKSVGFGIANSITDKDVEKIEQLEAQALMIAELANSMQAQSQKQFNEMMELFKATLNSPTPKTPKTGAEKKKKKCPHCGLEVYHKPDACYELDANASKRPADWKSKKST